MRGASRESTDERAELERVVIARLLAVGQRTELLTLEELRAVRACLEPLLSDP